MARILTLGHARDMGGHILGAHGVGGSPVNLIYGADDLSGADWSNGFISGGSRSGGALTLTDAEGYVYTSQVEPITLSAGTYRLLVTLTSDADITNAPIRTVFAANSAVGLFTLSNGVPSVAEIDISISGGTSVLSFGIEARDVIAPGGSNDTGYTITFSSPFFSAV